MSFIKDAIAYLVGLGQNKTYEIGGETYSDKDLVRIYEIPDRPQPITVTSLDSLVTLIAKEHKHFTTPTFIKVVNERAIEVFSSYDRQDKGNSYYRHTYYNVACDAPRFKPGWYDREGATTHLLSIFADNEGKNYVLDIISNLSQNSNVTTTDNGITQKVEMKSGVEIKSSTTIKPIVPLKPFRTFLEVEQPESNFLFRIGDKLQIGFLEADGGKWVLEAKKNIAAYLAEHLKDLVDAGNVVITV